MKLFSSIASADSSDFANILSGIYDFELPSVILAPVTVDQVFPHDQLTSANNVQLNLLSTDDESKCTSVFNNSSPPRKRIKSDSG